MDREIEEGRPNPLRKDGRRKKQTNTKDTSEM